MASLMIHMVVAQEFCKKNNIENIELFLKGNLSPDLTENKQLAHGVTDYKPLKNYDDVIRGRVNLQVCCKLLDLNDDFQKGVFLHLITDYYFYNHYMVNLETYKSITNKTHEKVNPIVYDEYGKVARVLISKFDDIRLDLLPDFARVVSEKDMVLFSKEGILNVIEVCSSFDLLEIFNKVKQEEGFNFIK